MSDNEKLHLIHETRGGAGKKKKAATDERGDKDKQVKHEETIPMELVYQHRCLKYKHYF